MISSPTSAEIKNDKEDTLTSSEQSQSQEKEETDIIKFSPPAYIQRYNRVSEELKKRLMESDGSPKSIFEVGCAELRMHRYLKTLPKVEKLMYLDIDEQLLHRAKSRVKPSDAEFLQPRETPLTVEVYSGCITKTDERVENVDPPLFAIIGIEIMEHLHEDVEIEFVYTLFARYSPPVIILTTPNSDFNTVLGLSHGEYRHWDHKFELSRQEFKNWCELVCEHFPWYKYHIEGICEGPKGTEDVGCLSQMAIFELKSDYSKDANNTSADLKNNHARFVSQMSKNKEDCQQQQQQQCQNEEDEEDKNLTATKGKEALKTFHSSSSTDNEISIDELVVQIESEPIIMLNELEPKSYVLIEKVEYPWKVKSTLQEQFCDEFRDFIVRDTLSDYNLIKYWEHGDTTTLVPFDCALEISQLLPDAIDLTEDQLRNWLEEDGYQLIGKGGAMKVVIEIPTHEEYLQMCSGSDDFEQPNNLFLDDEDWDS